MIKDEAARMYTFEDHGYGKLESGSLGFAFETGKHMHSA
jgi:hypothetical protein